MNQADLIVARIECAQQDRGISAAELARRIGVDFALLHYKMFKDAAGKTLKSILVSCNTRMEPFAIPQVRELVSRDEMELDRLGDDDGKRAVFASMSDTSSDSSAAVLAAHGALMHRPLLLIIFLYLLC